MKCRNGYGVDKFKVSRRLALFLVFTLLFQVIAPMHIMALTGGPSQPEVQSFAPIGTSDMVDPFTGDFSYNIPLLEIDGYPINIAYRAGITMDQEASWVGLGWNINPGVINRGMRGIPDDFKGDEVVKELKMKPNKTYGLNTGAGIELFGTDKLKLGIDYSIGINYNNYKGVGVEQSLNLALSAGEKGSSPLNGSLGITSSSDDGLSLNPSVGFSTSIGKSDKTNTQLGLSVGTAFSSRAGLSTLSVNANVSTSSTYKEGTQLSKDEADVATHDQGISASKGTSGSFDFGMPTYTPQGGPAMQNFSITGKFKLGLEMYGTHPNFTIGGYYSSQKLASNTIVNPAYGYLHADQGTKYDNSLLDFNREKDGTFSPSTPALPITNFTYDIYSVSGQGIGGSYRPFRGDIGHVFDPATNMTSDGISTGFELGLGNLTHFGFDLAVTDVTTKTGRWSNDNPAASNLTHKEWTGDPLYEKYYFKEANEKSVDADPNFLSSVGGSNARSILLNQLSKFHTIADHYYAQQGAISPINHRTDRERRSQLFTTLSRAELDSFGLEVRPHLNVVGSSTTQTKPHHIAEITTLRTDGARYVYGIALYNKKQEEVTFAVGNSLGNQISGRSGTADAGTGLVTYVAGDDSTTNGLGIDNYYSNTILPAYAHSYLLTAILSPDYVDSEHTDASNRGPSPGDIGNYTKFHYDVIIPNYNWKAPVGKNMATFNEGLKSDLTDDKANYVYGEKELRYLTFIESKNYIAVFELDDRLDGYGVKDKDGERAAVNSMKYLKRISLYTKPEYYKNDGTPPVPIKEVHFEYDYSLCPQTPNNINLGGTTNTGKLTLKKIYFTYQKSNKARFSPYQFTYSQVNPPYNIKGYDRWEGYKPNNPSSLVLPSAEYPYVEQDKVMADQYSQAWCLNEIKLPSGGVIKVEYESDDYAYVQNKRAMQMFKIVDVDISKSNSIVTQPGYDADIAGDNKYLFFKMQPGHHDPKTYFEGIDNLYFRSLVKIKGNNYEYVSGFAKIDSFGYNANINLGWVKLRTVGLSDNGGPYVNPIVLAAIQFGRLNMPRVVWDSGDMDNAIGDKSSITEDLLKAMMNSSFIKNIGQAIEGPNKALYNDMVGRSAVMDKSWIRLNNPNFKKLGGGNRAKRISISDEWASMTANTDKSFSYGQQYAYTLEDGTSSGVASYEPLLGGDENPWQQPVFTSERKLLAPDDEHYMVEPFGESFFPSPSVGYSRVTVQNLQYANVQHNATGSVVHEFYTAKNFPTIAERTSIVAQREKTNPFSLKSILRIETNDFMTASQGYVIEKNDMHGKPAAKKVYQESQSTPISSVEYLYKRKPYLNGAYRLDNKATVVYPDGRIDQAVDIGVFFDFVADMREHTTTTISGSINGNVDGFIVGVYPVYIPIIMPEFTRQKTQFRSAVVTKIIEVFGILEETIAKDLGSVVSTKNLAYDAETGNVLLTETTTNFNDKVYSLSYPAHWYYEGMGPAYRNIGFTKDNVNFNVGVATINNASKYFTEGDELSLSDISPTTNIQKVGWVSEVNASSIKVIKRDGTPVSGIFDVKVIQSGFQNQHEVPMASITSRSNPLLYFQTNIYEDVLQAQAMEFTNSWKTFCECFDDRGKSFTTNPFILGTKGMFKNKKSYLHLTGRTQSNYNSNTNIRNDGMFESYTPFYKLNAGRWEKDERNWTYTSEVTEFSPFGAELENRDALGRYSAATYGYNQTFPTAVAANSKYGQIGFDNFEDYAFSGCADDHFKFRGDATKVIESQSHTGNRSIRVTSGTPVNMTKQLLPCDTILTCDLQLDTITSANTICYIVSGGVPPYIFDWTISGCDMNVVISDSGDRICIANPIPGYCQLLLSVEDKNKCKKYFNPTVFTTSGN